MAITEIYVDPAINGNSGTGTSGDPYGDLQYALNTVTRDATNGNRFNIKAGTAETLAAALTLATYGTPTVGAPLVFQGYTSAAGDGGIGEISGAATYSIYLASGNSNKQYIHFYDLKMGNSGSAVLLDLAGLGNVVNCELYGSSNANGLNCQVGNGIRFLRCWFHDLSGTFNILLRTGTMLNCYIESAAGTYMVYCSGGHVINCILDIATDTSLHGLYTDSGMAVILNNSIYCSSANANNAIDVQTANGAIVMNNIVQGYSGTNGKAINMGGTTGVLVTGGNRYYNVHTAESVSVGMRYTLDAIASLGASPFTNPGSNDFSVANGTTSVSGAALPATWKGASTTGAADIGAVQAGAGAGGGGGPVIGGRIIRGLGAI